MSPRFIPLPDVTIRTNYGGQGVRPAIVAALRERFPDGMVPHGTYTEMAPEFGVTREAIRQAAVSIGYATITSRARRVCPVCEHEFIVRFGRQRFCSRECFLTTWRHEPKRLVCPECGKHFDWSPSQQTYTRQNLQRRIAHPEQYMPTCSRSCASKRGRRIGREKRLAAGRPLRAAASR